MAARGGPAEAGAPSAPGFAGVVDWPGFGRCLNLHRASSSLAVQQAGNESQPLVHHVTLPSRDVPSSPAYCSRCLSPSRQLLTASAVHQAGRDRNRSLTNRFLNRRNRRRVPDDRHRCGRRAAMLPLDICKRIDTVKRRRRTRLTPSDHHRRRHGQQNWQALASDRSVALKSSRRPGRAIGPQPHPGFSDVFG